MCVRDRVMQCKGRVAGWKNKTKQNNVRLCNQSNETKIEMIMSISITN